MHHTFRRHTQQEFEGKKTAARLKSESYVAGVGGLMYGMDDCYLDDRGNSNSYSLTYFHLI